MTGVPSGAGPDPQHVAELEEEERRYRTLLGSMDEGFCIIELLDGPHGPLSDYLHVEANAAFTANTGILDATGKRVRELVGEEADDWIALYREILLTGTPLRFERELELTGRYLSLHAFRLEPPERRQIGVLFQDITARKNAERDLIELNRTLEQRVAAALAEKRLLADIVEASDAMVQVADPEGRFLAINAASASEFEWIFGVRPKVGDNMFALLSGQPDALRDVKALWTRAFAGEVFNEVLAFSREGSPQRYYEMRYNGLRNEQGALIGAYQFVYDVTDRLEEQERLHAAEEALRQAQKMEAVGQLTGGLAHDFNNLLAGISGSLEMIGSRLAQGRTSEVEKYLAAAQGAARRAAALTHRLLAFARRQTLNPRALNVNGLLPDLVELVRRTVGPQIAVQSVPGEELWPASVDANQLENALLNLCINARDAMPEGGKLTIETANKRLDAATARQSGIDEGQYVTVCVSDTGIGIDKHTLEKVFDPFFTTKPLGEGTGLGLSMVYGFARQSQGHVRIHSEVGRGTMVCLYLPRHFGEVEAEARAAADEPASGNAGRSVLVIDDEPIIRMLVVDALEELGFQCIEAGDGPQGLAMLERCGHLDLLITDVGLPNGLNGREVADRARALQPGLKVLFITGYAENAALNHGHLGPDMQVLTKPFSVNELTTRIESLLG